MSMGDHGRIEESGQVSENGRPQIDAFYPIRTSFAEDSGAPDDLALRKPLIPDPDRPDPKGPRRRDNSSSFARNGTAHDLPARRRQEETDERKRHDLHDAGGAADHLPHPGWPL